MKNNINTQSINWNRNKKGQFTSDPRLELRKPRVKLICPNCGKEFELPLWRLEKSKYHYCSRRCGILKQPKKEYKKWSLVREFRVEHANEYRNLHKKVYKLFGRPTRCEHCSNSERKRFYWANKTGKYLLERIDWLMLCASCHYKYDYNKAMEILK